MWGFTVVIRNIFPVNEHGGALIELAMILTIFCALTAVVITAGIPNHISQVTNEINIDQGFVLSTLNPSFFSESEEIETLLSFDYAGNLRLAPYLPEVNSNPDFEAQSDSDSALYEDMEIPGIDRIISTLSRLPGDYEIFATILKVDDNGEIQKALNEPSFRTKAQTWRQSQQDCLQQMQHEASRVSGGATSNSLSNPYIYTMCVNLGDGKVVAAARRMIIDSRVISFLEFEEYVPLSSCYRANPYSTTCS